jgi:hypothetical protein
MDGIENISGSDGASSRIPPDPLRPAGESGAHCPARMGCSVIFWETVMENLWVQKLYLFSRTSLTVVSDPFETWMIPEFKIMICPGVEECSDTISLAWLQDFLTTLFLFLYNNNNIYI